MLPVLNFLGVKYCLGNISTDYIGIGFHDSGNNQTLPSRGFAVLLHGVGMNS